MDRYCLDWQEHTHFDIEVYNMKIKEEIKKSHGKVQPSSTRTYFDTAVITKPLCPVSL